MSRSGLIALCFALLLSAPLGARADTILSLSETASVSARPDEIAASLRAEATGSSAAGAQESVNRMMATSLDAAHEASGVRVSTGQYSVWLAESAPSQSGTPPASAVWHASQTLDLTTSDGPRMLALVGTLQGEGMAVQSLEWRLSTQAERASRAAALRQAITGLRARTEEVAGLLGLRFAAFRAVRLDAEPRVFPMRMRAMVATPPSVEQGPIEVSTTISAEAVLVAAGAGSIRP